MIHMLLQQEPIDRRSPLMMTRTLSSHPSSFSVLDEVNHKQEPSKLKPSKPSNRRVQFTLYDQFHVYEKYPEELKRDLFWSEAEMQSFAEAAAVYAAAVCYHYPRFVARFNRFYRDCRPGSAAGVLGTTKEDRHANKTAIEWATTDKNDSLRGLEIDCCDKIALDRQEAVSKVLFFHGQLKETGQEEGADALLREKSKGLNQRTRKFAELLALGDAEEARRIYQEAGLT
jgi:hypothetical protein